MIRLQFSKNPSGFVWRMICRGDSVRRQPARGGGGTSPLVGAMQPGGQEQARGRLLGPSHGWDKLCAPLYSPIKWDNITSLSGSPSVAFRPATQSPREIIGNANSQAPPQTRYFRTPGGGGAR